MTAVEGARTYRFGPLDRSGWLLGLGAAQCLGLAAGIVTAGLILQHGGPLPVALVPVLAGSILAFGIWEGRRFHEWLPLLLRFSFLRVSRRTRWVAPLPLLTASAADDGRPPALPPFLHGLELVDAGPVPWSPLAAGVGVVVDRRHRTVSGSVPARGRGFSLVERGDQDRSVQLWGDALAGFCTEHGQVCRLRITEWAAPGGVGDHERFLVGHAHAASHTEARRSYEELLATAGPAAVGHEVLVTVTVDTRRVRGASREAAPGQAAIAALLEELRLLTGRLDAAGLSVGPPLSAGDTATALRRRLDPSNPPLLVRGGSLAELAGLLAPRNMGPLASETGWGRIRTDGSVHRSYWVAEWPRLEVGPAWVEPLILHAGGVRTVAIHLEPVPPSRSQRHIERDATRLAADEEQRTRHGFRVGARHHRARAAVAEREAELVAGYAELEFAGFVTVSAADEDALARSCAEYEQVAAQAGLELRALDARHDLGLVCSLPVGRGLARRIGF